MRKSILSSVLPLFAGLAFSLGASAMTAQPESKSTAMNDEMSMQGEMQGDIKKYADTAGQMSMATVDLNKADAATLQKELTGIGKAKAEAIVAYREAHGPFASVDELLEIKGIGNALLERNRDKVRVK